MPDPAITLEDIVDIQTLTATDATASYRAIDALAERVFGHRLFTVTRSLHETGEVERAYSSNPAAYPVGGRKRKAGTEWGARVLERGEPLFCHSPADIERVFADHALILSLGIGAMVNMPVLFGGRSVATMNVSYEDDRFGDADLPTFGSLAALLLPLVLGGATAQRSPTTAAAES
jgi:hypothetical protein